MNDCGAAPSVARRVIVLSIEVCSPEEIEGACRRGVTPNLDRLRRGGCWAPMTSASNVSSGAIWPSFSTGMNPGKHGIANFHMQLVNGSYRVDRYTARQVRGTPFWKILNDAGKRCAVLDVPVTAPIPGFNGLIVSAWGVEGPAWERETWPPEFLAEITRNIGEHPLPNDDYRRSIRPETLEAQLHIADVLLKGVEMKHRLARYMLEKGPWDLFVAVFSESHWSDHVMYHLLHPWHIEYNPEFAGRIPDFADRLLAAQDAAIGDLLRDADDALVFVLSGSGTRPSYGGSHILPDVLARLGYGPEGEQAASHSPDAEFETERKWGYYRVRKIQDVLSTTVISAVKKMVPGRIWARTVRRLLYAGSGWEKSKAFCLPNDFCGSIRLNLEGREPDGKVAAADYDRVCTHLMDELMKLTNPSTGERAVVDVFKSRETYHGQEINNLPDLIVVWSHDSPIESLQSPTFGTIKGKNPERRTGSHSPNGFLLMAGPGVQRGATLDEVNMVDIAPTVLNALGQTPPPDMDGRILVEAFAPSSVAV